MQPIYCLKRHFKISLTFTLQPCLYNMPICAQIYPFIILILRQHVPRCTLSLRVNRRLDGAYK